MSVVTDYPSNRGLPLVTADGRRPLLLVVDDEPLTIQVMYQVFYRDYEVLTATSGRSALAVCEQKRPDLILLDVVMPEIDGFEVCRRLKQDPATREIPIIFCTVQDHPDDEARGLELGAVDFINKPINRAVVLARVRTHLTLKAQADALRSLAFMDGLTGVANRRHFDERLEAEWGACRRSGSPLALIMVDVDHFKAFNDRYGHHDGDDCLRRIASTLESTGRRSSDLVARFGGEEFVCLLPGTDIDGAVQRGEALRAAVEVLQIPHEHSTANDCVTISVGVAVLRPDESVAPADLIDLADQQLYVAKKAGRNRVECGGVGLN